MLHSKTTKDIFKNHKLVIANKQSPNMKSLLTRAKFTSEMGVNRVYKCSSKCVSCKNIKEGDEHLFKSVQQRFRVKSNFTCTTKNIIYVIICGNPECREEYIGQSSLEIRFRISVHKQQVKDKELRKLYVSKHIFECGKGQFEIFPFYKMYSNNEMERIKKEEYFINKYKPTLNRN